MWLSGSTSRRLVVGVHSYELAIVEPIQLWSKRISLRLSTVHKFTEYLKKNLLISLLRDFFAVGLITSRNAEF